MSKSVLRAANWVNIASCQFAFGTVLTLMVAFGRSFLYSAFAKASSAWAGGQSNQMKLRVSGSLVSSGMVAGALGALAFAPSSLPSPQAATVVATSSMAAVASCTFRPGTDIRPIRFGYRIFCLLSGWGLLEPRYVLRRAVAGLFRRVAGLSRGPTRGPASRVRRDVLGLHAVEKSFGPLRPGGEPSRTSSMLMGAPGDRSGAMAGGSAMVQDGGHPSPFLYDPSGGVSMPQRCDRCQQVPEDARKDLTSRWTTKR